MSDWFPKSGYQLARPSAESPDFFERYTEDVLSSLIDSSCFEPQNSRHKGSGASCPSYIQKYFS
jgi:hypothetical protein